MSALRILLYEQLKPKGIPYSKQWIGELERKHQFPQRVRFAGGQSGARVGWFEHEIDEYLLSLPRGSGVERPPWLQKDDNAAPVAPRRCSYPECDADCAERAGSRGPQPKYCERHGHRRVKRETGP